MNKTARIVLPLAALLLAAPAMADTVIFQQDFNGYSDATLLTAVPNFYDWTGGSNVPTIVGGAVVANGAALHDTLIDLGGDVFSHGSDHITVELDLTLPQAGEMNVFVGAGNAAGLDFNYGQVMGYQSGWYTPHYVYAFNGGGFDYGDVAQLQNFVGHLKFDAVKTGTSVTWGAFLDGNPLWTGSSGNARTYTLDDARGMNTIEIYGQFCGVGQTQVYDNLKITAINGAPPWPDYIPGDFNKDGQVGPEDFGILKDQFGLSGLTHGNHDSWTLGDANDDGQIGPEDFGLLKDNFGRSGGPTGTYPLSNVPEPTTLALLALGGLLAARRNRRS